MVELRENEFPNAAGESGFGDMTSDEPAFHDASHPAGEERSLIDDVEALIDDARTYLGAELSYQKSRAAFVSDRLKKTIVFGVGAGVLGFIAAIGLTVGLIIALTPLVTGWGATAIVIGVELLIVYLLIKRAARSWRSLMSVVKESDTESTHTTGEA